MKWIDSKDIRRWAGTRDCQETLPHLVRKLIRATSNSISSIKFPSGDNILIGGWDGILEVSKATEYLPLGISLWEFGTTTDVKGKADEDYEKRTKNPLGFNAAESTFVFVTPQLWIKGKDWEEERKKEGIWKDIKVINAETLEEWIELAPAVGAWLATKHLNKYPSEDIQATEDFLEEWSAGVKFQLPSEILVGGRRNEIGELTNRSSVASIIPIEGISKEEALAFIIACFKNNADKEEDFFSRSIIVDTSDAFKQLTVFDKPLILIPRFEDNGVFNRAVQNGHTIIVPLGVDSSIGWAGKIVLPKIDRESFVIALVSTGMSKINAEKYSKESARNITVLRRQLGFTRATPNWALPDNVRDIIPALIVGRWDENFENDKKILALAAGESYDDYSKKLLKWLYVPDSPIVKIGSSWRLISPFDAWTYTSRNLTTSDFEMLYDIVKQIILEINPSLELSPEQRHMASIYGKKREYSEWIREGVVQSLILTSVFGDKLQFSLSMKAELWVDRIVAELLNTDDSLIWKSFGKVMPLIAEASPRAFLNAVEKQLLVVDSPIISLFEGEQGFMNTYNHHPNLLWALESLAWFPEYLSRVSLILSTLCAKAPESKIVNSPINSLTEIFKPWHYQTLASFEERIQVLRLIAQREKEVAWTLLVNMLPELTSATAQPTHRTRWRMFEEEIDSPVTYKEIYDTHSVVTDILIDVFDNTEEKFSTFIKESVNLLPDDRNKLLDFVESHYENLNQVKYEPWHTVRGILHHHRSYPNANWALSKNDLNRYEKIYGLLMPANEIEKAIWMFNEHWPDFVEGHEYSKVPTDEQEKIITTRRIEGLKGIYVKFGLGKIIELNNTVKENVIFGDILAHIVKDEEEIFTLCGLLKKEGKELIFVQSIIFRKFFLEGKSWVLNLSEKLKAAKYDNVALVNLFLAIPQSKEVWDYIEEKDVELVNLYWKKMFPHFFRIEEIEEKCFGLQKLIEHKRFHRALEVSRYFVNEIPSSLIIQMLENGGGKSDEVVNLDGFEINRLFETLDIRDDYDSAILIKLEWIYLPLLTSYRNSRKPVNLHNRLSENPVFFVEILELMYRADSDKKKPMEQEEIVDEQKKSRALQGYNLLRSWVKIPGTDNEGKIEGRMLRDWVNNARSLAKEKDRLVVADIHIGKLLAQYPEKKDVLWPPEQICQIIEEVNSDTLRSNFSDGTYNNKGFSIRGAFQGGGIEREKAKRFEELASAHRDKFPAVSLIFDNLNKSFLRQGESMDEDAERDMLEY